MRENRIKINEDYSPNGSLQKKKYVLRTESDELVRLCQNCPSPFRSLHPFADILPAIKRGDILGDLYCTMLSVTCPTLIREQGIEQYRSALEEAATPNTNFKPNNTEKIDYKKPSNYKKPRE